MGKGRLAQLVERLLYTQDVGGSRALTRAPEPIAWDEEAAKLAEAAAAKAEPGEEEGSGLTAH